MAKLFATFPTGFGDPLRQTLTEIGRTLRSYTRRSSLSSFRQTPFWSADLADPAGGSVICHNDVCICSILGPLLNPLSAAAPNGAHLDPYERVRLLADAYGLDDEGRQKVTRVLMQVFLASTCNCRDGRAVYNRGTYRAAD